MGAAKKIQEYPARRRRKKIVFSPPQAENFGILSQPCAHFDFD
jgi:hypothetical protein